MGNYWLDKAHINTGWTLNINNVEEFVVDINQEPTRVQEKLLYSYDLDGRPIMIDGKARFEPLQVTHFATDTDDRFIDVMDFLLSREPVKLTAVLKYYEDGKLTKRWNISEAFFIHAECSVGSDESLYPTKYMAKLAFCKAELGTV